MNAEFLFICGAVGSGNTFMFQSITEDTSVYGVNEDAVGNMLRRLVESEREMGKCAHSLVEYVKFLHALRGDRQTLILKTPSNIRYTEHIAKYLPNSRFICMLREPRAAIASGLARHGAPVAVVAQKWLEDTECIRSLPPDSMVVTFEALVSKPVPVLRRVSEKLLPLQQSVFDYAQINLRSDRSNPGRWMAKVDNDTKQEILSWVESLQLQEIYDVLSRESDGVTVESIDDISAPSLTMKQKLQRPLTSVSRAVRKAKRLRGA